MDSKLVVLTPVEGGSPRPDQSLPPSRTWPPTAGYPLPDYPDQGLPGGDVGTPDHPVVMPPLPTQLPVLPPSIWPGVPIHPETPDNSLPLPPGMVYPPLPPALDGKLVLVAWVPTVGFRYVVVDTRAQPKPPTAGTPTPKASK